MKKSPPSTLPPSETSPSTAVDLRHRIYRESRTYDGILRQPKGRVMTMSIVPSGPHKPRDEPRPVIQELSANKPLVQAMEIGDRRHPNQRTTMSFIAPPRSPDHRNPTFKRAR